MRLLHPKWQKVCNKKSIKIALTVVVLLGVFSSGWAIGKGKISISLVNHRSSEQKGLPEDLDYSSVEQVYDTLRQNFDGQVTVDQLMNGLKKGLVEATGDPYTEYFSGKDAQDFNEQLTGTFSGIGAELSKDTKTNSIIIISPITGYPAEKAGLKPKDVVVSIDGKSTSDMTITDAINRIRGPKGTNVTLKILRDSNTELTMTITREEITIPSVKSKIINGNIGYLEIDRFGPDTSNLARTAATSFKQANVKGVILDVRSNPGGLLSAAVDVSSLWLHNKTVLQEKRDGLLIHEYDSENTDTLLNVPTVVLINDGSASASEIVSGALHDNHAATLIGKKSFGKGSVQEIEQLSGGSALKVTIARWYTPSGKNIDKEGITPDQVVDRTADDAKNGKDPQLDAALQFLNK